MRTKDISKWFETLLTTALAASSDKDRPGIIAAAYILKELCIDIKIISESVEAMAAAEEEKLKLLRATKPPAPPARLYGGFSHGLDDDIPF
jgi:hypothetical protein